VARRQDYEVRYEAEKTGKSKGAGRNVEEQLGK